MKLMTTTIHLYKLISFFKDMQSMFFIKRKESYKMRHLGEPLKRRNTIKKEKTDNNS
jgi:hypothetical protein